MLQEIVQPKNEREWGVLNRLNAQSIKIEIKPGGIFADIPHSTGRPITVEELETKVSIHRYSRN